MHHKKTIRLNKIPLFVPQKEVPILKAFVKFDNIVIKYDNKVEKCTIKQMLKPNQNIRNKNSINKIIIVSKYSELMSCS